MTRPAMATRSVWAVEVAYEDQDPGTFGPYTEAQAKRVENALKKEVTLATDRHGINHHPLDVRGAIAFPLARYGDFVTTSSPDFLPMRNDVRAANAIREQS